MCSSDLFCAVAGPIGPVWFGLLAAVTADCTILLIDRFEEAMTTVCVGSVVLLPVFGSAVPAQAEGAVGVGPGVGQRPEVMLAGFDTIVPPETDSFTFTKKVTVPL